MFAGSHGVCDSGASGHFCVSRARPVRTVDDSIFLPRWAAGIPSVDDARGDAMFCDRSSAVPCTDSHVIELLKNTGRRNRHSARELSIVHSSEIWCLLDEGFRGLFRFAKVFAVRTYAPTAIDLIVDN